MTILKLVPIQPQNRHLRECQVTAPYPTENIRAVEPCAVPSPGGFKMQRRPLNRLALVIGDEEHELDGEQLARLNDWLARLVDKIDQKHTKLGWGPLVRDLKRKGKVYTGASGGNLTFSVTPTNIGMVFKVADSITGENIELSDYDKW